MTVKNMSGGVRFLRNQYMIVKFADGTWSEARNLDDRVDGNALYTKAVYFGRNKFPIIAIDMRENLMK